MAPKGKPRDMRKSRELLLDSNVHFPGEPSEYRHARNELLDAEGELHRLSEQVAAQRRALPAGGLIREDYVFQSAADGSKVRLSELFAPGKSSLVIYNMMFPRWSEDLRAGAPAGKTAELPLVEQPCPSCTSMVDGLEGAAFHLAERTNLVAIAKTSPERLGTYAQECAGAAFAARGAADRGYGDRSDPVHHGCRRSPVGAEYRRGGRGTSPGKTHLAGYSGLRCGRWSGCGLIDAIALKSLAPLALMMRPAAGPAGKC